MNTFVEVLNKSATKLELAWKPESTSGISGYNVYVGQTAIAASLVKVISNVSPLPSNEPGSYKKVVSFVTANVVQTALGLSTDFNFSNLILYCAITYIDNYGIESSIGDSTIVEIPPVGILGKTMKEDPTQNRHVYGFSDELQRWIKTSASSKGAVIVDASDYFKANMTSEYTRDASGNILTVKSYFSDRTTSGSPAKLTTYTYDGAYVSKVVVTDSTV